MSIISMKIRPCFIDLIKKGIKKHEYRLATPERRQVNIGDKIALVNNQDLKTYVIAKVLKKEIYPNWEEPLKKYWEDDFKTLYSNIDEAIKECSKFYEKELVEQNGIIVYTIENYHENFRNCRILLDTNIIIQRESETDVSLEVPKIFNYLDKLGATKYYHPQTKIEISHYNVEQIRNNILKKLGSYEELHPNKINDLNFNKALQNYSQKENSLIDNELLYQVYSNKVDYLLTDDKNILRKAEELYLSDFVFSSIDLFNRLSDLYPKLIDYNVLSIKKMKFGDLNINDEFFDTLREDYNGDEFNRWFYRKNDESAYVVFEKDKIKGFLYLKKEDQNENYSNITPIMEPKVRLKIGTFKNTVSGTRMGERFLKIIFDNARNMDVDEIYVTLFENRRGDVQLLKNLFEKWGFYKHGLKDNGESVFIKDMRNYNSQKDPKYNYPLIRPSNFGFMPIEGKYHSVLFPDLFLKNENMKLIREKPCSYALEKFYIAKYNNLSYKPGDIMLIYRKGDYWPKKYTSVVSGIAILQEIVYTNSISELKEICKNKTVFEQNELEDFYNRREYKTVIKLLFLDAFKYKVILNDLYEKNILEAPSGPRLDTMITENNYKTIKKMGENNDK